MGSIRSRADNELLFFDFRFEGRRCRDQTLLQDSAPNRKRMQKVLEKIEQEIASGTFVYEAYFPNAKPRAQSPGSSPPVAGTEATPQAAAVSLSAIPSFTVFAEQWFTEHKVEWRRSHIKVLRSTLDGHLQKHFGAKPVSEISKADILAFRRDEGLLLTEIDYDAVPGLSNEARNKLGKARPRTVGQAGRLDGITPAALGILAAYIRREARKPKVAAAE